MKPQNVSVEIDELLLKGFDRVEAAEVGASLRAELGRLLTHSDWSGPQLDALTLTELAGGRFKLPADANARRIGYELAQQVYQGISRVRAGDRTPTPPTAAAPRPAQGGES